MEAYLDTTKSLDTLIVGAGFAGMYSLYKQLSDGFKAEIMNKQMMLEEHGIGIDILELDAILKVWIIHIHFQKNCNKNGIGKKNMELSQSF